MLNYAVPLGVSTYFVLLADELFGSLTDSSSARGFGMTACAGGAAQEQENRSGRHTKNTAIDARGPKQYNQNRNS